MKPPYEALLERLRRAGIPDEIVQALLHHDRFGQDLRWDQRVVEGLIECYRTGQIRLDPDGALRLTERARKPAERTGRCSKRTMRPSNAIKIRPELAQRLNALFPRMYRITESVLHVSDDVLARIKTHMKPGETESDVIGRFLDVYRDSQLDEFMRGIS